MRKKILSLALALAMCLGLTVPAFAAEANYKLEVSSKPSAFVGERTFTVRGWDRSEPYEDEYGELMDTLTKTGSHQYTVSNLYIMSKGDTAVVTKGGESFEDFRMTAWSDPDGDGVYDARLIGLNWGEILSADTAGPVRSCLSSYDEETGDMYATGFVLQIFSGQFRVTEGVNSVGNGTEVTLSADHLLERLGPNTLIHATTLDEDWSFTILVEGNATQPTTPSFTDVKADAFYAKPVAWAVEKGVTAGTSATTFSPNATCTQGQILTFLWRAKSEPKPSGAVSGTQYYATAAQWAKEQGLTDNFSAEADCTRAMVVSYLWKLAGSPKAGTSNFSDVSANADYAQAVAWAVEQGITSGTSATTFSPDVTCTRGQIVTFLYRAFAK